MEKINREFNLGIAREKAYWKIFKRTQRLLAQGIHLVAGQTQGNSD